MNKSTFLHLRFPFSFFLMPVFWFAISVVGIADYWQAGLVFFILHVLVYPASNGFNSYFDKDEGSIGGLEHPPTTTKNLYNWSIILDSIALLLGLLIGWQFSCMLLVYGLVSKAYSHPWVRLKKRPILGWLSVSVFQGYFVFIMTVFGVSGMTLDQLFVMTWQWPAILASALLLGSYPMTQIYQHDEDRSRGDMTLSIHLGVNGTFYFTGIFFFLSNLGFLYYYLESVGMWAAIGFQFMLTPVVLYFLFWFWKVRKDVSKADFHHTMRLNLLSAIMLNIFFIALFIITKS